MKIEYVTETRLGFEVGVFRNERRYRVLFEYAPAVDRTTAPLLCKSVAIQLHRKDSPLTHWQGLQPGEQRTAILNFARAAIRERNRAP